MSDSAFLRLHTWRFNAALASFAAHSKKDGLQVLLDAAKQFVRRAIAVTPPGKGKADPAARKRGEAAIAADLSRIMKPGNAKFLKTFRDFHGGDEASESFGHVGAAALGLIYTRILRRSEMVSWHEARRNKSGRVMKVNRDATTGLRKRDLRGLDLGLAATADYQWFKKRVQGRVGLLAAGWNRAAERLGYTPPAWIKRHGQDRGGVQITVGKDVFRVQMSNDVKFAETVKDLESRVQKALDDTAAAMERKVAFFLEKSGKKAGFK